MRKGRSRVVAGVVTTALAAAALLAYATLRASSAPAPTSLLAIDAALPRTWIDDFGRDAVRRPLGWRTEPPIGGDDVCAHGRGALRVWSTDPDPLARPAAFETVCVYRFELLARLVYKWQSLYKVGGDDWPNFDPSLSSVKLPEPHPAASLGRLHADASEIGCGLGEPDGLCAIWTFRARYGRVTTVVEFQSDAGGIRFDAMRRLVRSIDRDLAGKLHRA